MGRRFWLVAVWALFASAAIGVGFGAAGLVGEEFAGALPRTGLTTTPTGQLTPEPSSTAPSGPTSPSGSTSPGGTTSASATGTPTGEPSGSASETPSSRPTGTPRPPRTSAPPRSTPPVTRSLQTRAGVVVATCRNGLVRLGTSPAVDWRIERIETGWLSEAEVRFERDEDGVEVKASCAAGRPRFELDDDANHGDDGGEESSSPDEGESSGSGSGGED